MLLKRSSYGIFSSIFVPGGAIVIVVITDIIAASVIWIDLSTEIAYKYMGRRDLTTDFGALRPASPDCTTIVLSENRAIYFPLHKSTF